jgi:serine/threonine-protein kinase
MKDKDGSDFGNLAVAMGFLSKEDLQKAINFQEDFRKSGTEKRLGEVCLEKRLLTREQVLLILRGQGKRILTCTKCKKSYNVHHFRLGGSYPCKRCGSQLQLPTKPVRPSVVGSVGAMSASKVRALMEGRVEKPPPKKRKAVLPELVHLLPGYEITEILGKGGMGAVYKARDTILGRWVAVKLLAPILAENKEYVDRFFREARNLQKLRHPNIVEAYDAGVAGFHKFFIMEYVDGASVDRLLDERRKLSESEALGITRQIAGALDYAWQRKIVHRDVKPQNMLRSSSGVVKLCDLGLSKDIVTDISITMTGSVNCTPPYASPEQSQGLSDVDCRSDVYSLGVVLFLMTTGELPFTADSPGQYLIQHVTKPPPDPAGKNPDLSPKVAKLILRMLEKQPADRPTPGEVAGVIDKYLNGGSKALPS